MTETLFATVDASTSAGASAEQPRRLRRRRTELHHEPTAEAVERPPPPKRHHIDRRAADVAAEGVGDPDQLLTTSDISEWLGLSTQWLEIGRSRGYGPPFVRLSPRRVRYLRSSVLDWLRERQHRATAEYSGVKNVAAG